MRRARRAFGAARRARRGIVALGLRTAAIDDARGDRRAASLRTREGGESRCDGAMDGVGHRARAGTGREMRRRGGAGRRGDPWVMAGEGLGLRRARTRD